MAKFEAHITMPVEHAQIVKVIGEDLGWKFSQIDGDALMGAKPYCYLTGYRPGGGELLMAMRQVETAMQAAGVPVLRLKVERIVYDTKTGVDELAHEALRALNDEAQDLGIYDK